MGGGLNEGKSDPNIQERIADVSLNGAQVAAIIDTIAKITTGELKRDGAIELITTAFPIDRSTAIRIIGDET